MLASGRIGRRRDRQDAINRSGIYIPIKEHAPEEDPGTFPVCFRRNDAQVITFDEYRVARTTFAADGRRFVLYAEYVDKPDIFQRRIFDGSPPG